MCIDDTQIQCSFVERMYPQGQEGPDGIPIQLLVGTGYWWFLPIISCICIDEEIDLIKVVVEVQIINSGILAV